MNYIKQAIVYLDGKKTILLSISMLIFPFLSVQGLITVDLSNLILGILGIVCGGTKLVSDQAILTPTDDNLGGMILRKRNK